WRQLRRTGDANLLLHYRLAAGLSGRQHAWCFPAAVLAAGVLRPVYVDW
ncbi:iron(III) ABC transporter, permease protein, partial [Escherichia coli N1]